MLQTRGLQKRWLRNTLSLVLALVLVCVTALSVTVAAYYYSNMEAGMESKARASTSFFENYIGQSYNEFYRSCAKFAQTFEAKDVMELQFINTNNRIVASSYGRFSGKVSVTSDITSAIATKQISSFTGTNPATGERLVESRHVRVVKTLMVTCGMYDGSGEFAIRVGIPAKSGVGGGIMACVENRMGIAAFGPALDPKGNSVGAYRILEYLSQALNLHYFAGRGL